MIEHSGKQDRDQTLDIIDHINQDHPEELLAIVLQRRPELTWAKVIDIVEHGMLVRVKQGNEQDKEPMFIGFEIEGEIEEKILYLAYDAIVKQGRDFSNVKKNFFQVKAIEVVSRNIIRLTLKSKIPLPEYYPGYALAFSLSTMTNIPKKKQSIRHKKSKFKQLFDIAFMWVVKHLSVKNRQKLLYGINKNIRLYTLRKTWQGGNEQGIYDHANVDIYCHEQSPGSLWCKRLKQGDVLVSRSEAKDNHRHLHSGQAVLIADETAFPAVAGMLEQWINPIPPIVILLPAKATEISYFDEVQLPLNTLVHTVAVSPQQQADEALVLLQQLDKIETVWGACESASARRIRHYLRNDRKLPGKLNHIKAYWRLSPTQPQ